MIILTSSLDEMRRRFFFTLSICILMPSAKPFLWALARRIEPGLFNDTTLKKMQPPISAFLRDICWFFTVCRAGVHCNNTNFFRKSHNAVSSRFGKSYHLSVFFSVKAFPESLWLQIHWQPAPGYVWLGAAELCGSSLWAETSWQNLKKIVKTKSHGSERWEWTWLVLVKHWAVGAGGSRATLEQRCLAKADKAEKWNLCTYVKDLH